MQNIGKNENILLPKSIDHVQLIIPSTAEVRTNKQLWREDDILFRWARNYYN